MLPVSYAYVDYSLMRCKERQTSEKRRDDIAAAAAAALHIKAFRYCMLRAVAVVVVGGPAGPD